MDAVASTVPPLLRQARTSHRRPKPGLIMGYQQADGTREMDLLLPPCDHRHLQPKGRGMVRRRHRERRSLQAPVRKRRRQSRRPAWPTHPARRSWPVHEGQGHRPAVADLGVTKSHSRPYTSDDNPFSESCFKTLKYPPQFPKRFGCIQDAKTFCRAFFDWCNQGHHHLIIGLMTPDQVHYGHVSEVHASRQLALDHAFRGHPKSPPQSGSTSQPRSSRPKPNLPNRPSHRR